MATRLHYPCRLRIDGASVFVLWYSDERDGLARDEAGRPLTASTLEELTAVARARDLAFDADSDGDEPAEHDLDRIRAWCSTPDAGTIDCPPFLDAWNFFDDADEGPQGSEDDRLAETPEASACYDRLFWGCNLPAVTPPGEHFEPKWRADEVDLIRRVLELGLRLLKSQLRTSVD